MLRLMGEIVKLIWWVVIGLFRSRASLEVEILALHHQLNVLCRKSPKRVAFSTFDRLFFACRFSLVPAMEVAISRQQTQGWRSKFAN
jgi:hypothetical protein